MPSPVTETRGIIFQESSRQAVAVERDAIIYQVIRPSGGQLKNKLPKVAVKSVITLDCSPWRGFVRKGLEKMIPKK